MLIFSIIGFKASAKIFSEFTLKKLPILTSLSISKYLYFQYFSCFFLLSIAYCIRFLLFAADIISKGVCFVELCFFLVIILQNIANSLIKIKLSLLMILALISAFCIFIKCLNWSSTLWMIMSFTNIFYFKIYIQV